MSETAGRHTEDVIATYRYLRIAMPLLVVVLTAALVTQIVQPDPNCWLGSISAYYYTPARAVFVAGLCSIGTCLIVYRGSSVAEDVLLNASGFLAFNVAFIPTPRSLLNADPAACDNVLPTQAQLDASVDNNIIALLVGGVVMVLVTWGMRLRSPVDGRVGRLGAGPLVGSTAAIAAFVALFVSAPDLVRDNGHIASAILLFVGVVGVVMLNASAPLSVRAGVQPPPAASRRLYRLVLIAMGVTLVGLGVPALFGWFDHAVFWLEAGLIGEFALFWVVQTRELWGVVGRPALAEADVDAQV